VVLRNEALGRLRAGVDAREEGHNILIMACAQMHARPTVSKKRFGGPTHSPIAASTLYSLKRLRARSDFRRTIESNCDMVTGCMAQ